jgi:ammonia channel protein AmtB
MRELNSTTYTATVFPAKNVFETAERDTSTAAKEQALLVQQRVLVAVALCAF